MKEKPAPRRRRGRWLSPQPVLSPETSLDRAKDFQRSPTLSNSLQLNLHQRGIFKGLPWKVFVEWLPWNVFLKWLTWKVFFKWLPRKVFFQVVALTSISCLFCNQRILWQPKDFQSSAKLVFINFTERLDRWPCHSQYFTNGWMREMLRFSEIWFSQALMIARNTCQQKCDRQTGGAKQYFSKNSNGRLNVHIWSWRHQHDWAKLCVFVSFLYLYF